MAAIGDFSEAFGTTAHNCSRVLYCTLMSTVECSAIGVCGITWPPAHGPIASAIVSTELTRWTLSTVHCPLYTAL